MKYIVNEKLNDASGFTAYAKARMDVEDVLTSEGFLPLVVTYTKANLKSFKERTKRQFDAYRTWKNALKGLGKGDSLVIQYPEDNNCQLLGFLFNSLKRKGVKIVALVHDIDLLRFGNPGYGKVKWMLYRYLEVQKINSFSKLILHNEKMKETAVRECSLPEEKIVPLGIFDYVLDKSILEEKTGFDRSVIIAGNLDKRKVKYIAELPDDLKFELYGIGFTDEGKSNIHYNGKFSPDELPKYLKGGFGLVWDGETAATCSGKYGQYLKINNPHKTSLYLASGIPVVIWEEAALASFIKEHNCGITVPSLYDIKGRLDSMTEEEYMVLKENARKVGDRLVAGEYIRNAVKNALGE